MLVRNFELWAACQRLFNVTPAQVLDLRNVIGEGTVRFLATLHNAGCVDVADCYDNDDLVALGIEDVETDDRIMAAEDTFMGAPCVVVVRSAVSFLEPDCQALEVTIFPVVSEDTLRQATDLVRATSLPEHFHSFCDDDVPVAGGAERPNPDDEDRSHAAIPEPRQLSWLERLFGRSE